MYPTFSSKTICSTCRLSFLVSKIRPRNLSTTTSANCRHLLPQLRCARPLTTKDQGPRSPERDLGGRQAMESPFRADLLRGKAALVTGGGSGIGFEIAAQRAPWRARRTYGPPPRGPGQGRRRAPLRGPQGAHGSHVPVDSLPLWRSAYHCRPCVPGLSSSVWGWELFCFSADKVPSSFSSKMRIG
jgi:hypothetical protein